MRNSCKDCPDRHPNCHSECEVYKAGVAERAKRKEIEKQMQQDNAVYRWQMKKQTHGNQH